MGKIGASTTAGPTFETLRSRLEKAKASGELVLLTSSHVIARSNGMIKVDVNSREMPDFTSYVNAGAKLLDETDPGWWRHIDVSTLDLDDENRCLLGQSWSHYVTGRNLLKEVVDTTSAKSNQAGLTATNFSRFLAKLFPSMSSNQDRRDHAANYGFQLPRNVITWINYEGKRKERETGRIRGASGKAWCWELLDEVWEHLTATWVVLIQARQAAAKAEEDALAESITGLDPAEIARRILAHRN